MTGKDKSEGERGSQIKEGYDEGVVGYVRVGM